MKNQRKRKWKQQNEKHRKYYRRRKTNRSDQLLQSRQLPSGDQSPKTLPVSLGLSHSCHMTGVTCPNIIIHTSVSHCHINSFIIPVFMSTATRFMNSQCMPTQHKHSHIPASFVAGVGLLGGPTLRGPYTGKPPAKCAQGLNTGNWECATAQWHQSEISLVSKQLHVIEGAPAFSVALIAAGTPYRISWDTDRQESFLSPRFISSAGANYTGKTAWHVRIRCQLDAPTNDGNYMRGRGIDWHGPVVCMHGE